MPTQATAAAADGPARVFASQQEACAWHVGRLPAGCDSAALLDLAGLWRARAALDERLPPDTRPMTRVDAHAAPALTGLLARLGCGARVRARADLTAAVSAGISGADILLDNPCKPRSLIALARRHGVAMATFDSESEAARLAELWPEVTALLLVRPAAAPDADTDVVAALGADPTAVPDVLAAARRCGLDVAGVAVAVDADEADADVVEDAWDAALASARAAIVAGRTLGHRMSLLDLGAVGPSSSSLLLADLLARHFDGDDDDDAFPVAPPPKLLCDPTDALLARSVLVATRVVARQPASGGVGGWRYAVGESAFGAFTGRLRGASPPALLAAVRVGDNRRRPTAAVTAAWLDGVTDGQEDRQLMGGGGCCYRLPELRPGDDWLVWAGAGASGSRQGRAANGLPEPAFRCFLQSGEEPLPPAPPSAVRQTVARSRHQSCCCGADADAPEADDAAAAEAVPEPAVAAAQCCSVLLS